MIADTLVEEETITSEQIMNLMNYGTLDNPNEEKKQTIEKLEADATDVFETERVEEQTAANELAESELDEALKELTKDDFHDEN